MGRDIDRPPTRSELNRLLIANALTKPVPNIVVPVVVAVAGIVLGITAIGIVVALVAWIALAATTYFDGDEAARVAVEVSALLFGAADPSVLSPGALDALQHEVPFAEVPAPTDGALDAVELFALAKLAPSKGAARRLLEQGGLYVNGRRLGSENRAIPTASLLAGRHLLLRKGAREYCLVRVGH